MNHRVNLIYQHDKQKRKTPEGMHGLTIPYLVGAETVVNSEYTPDVNSISGLFKELINDNSSNVFELRYCGDNLGAWVIGIYRKNNDRDEKWPSFEGIPQKKVCVIDLYNQLGGSIDDVVNHLSTGVIMKYILAGKYSCEIGTFSNYSDTEREFINKNWDIKNNVLLGRWENVNPKDVILSEDVQNRELYEIKNITVEAVPNEPERFLFTFNDLLREEIHYSVGGSKYEGYIGGTKLFGSTNVKLLLQDEIMLCDRNFKRIS